MYHRLLRSLNHKGRPSAESDKDQAPSAVVRILGDFSGTHIGREQVGIHGEIFGKRTVRDAQSSPQNRMVVRSRGQARKSLAVIRVELRARGGTGTGKINRVQKIVSIPEQAR